MSGVTTDSKKPTNAVANSGVGLEPANTPANGKNAAAAVTDSARAVADQTGNVASKSLAAAGQVGQSASALPAKSAQVVEAGARSALEAARAATDTVSSQSSVSSSVAKSTMERVMTTTEDLVAFNQGNVEAFVKSTQIWAAGVQDLGKHVAESAQAQLDQTISAWKSLAAVRSVKEAVELQTALTRNSIEKAVSDSGRLADASLKLAEQTIAPLTARVTVVSERFGRAA